MLKYIHLNITIGDVVVFGMILLGVGLVVVGSVGSWVTRRLKKHGRD